MLDHAKVYLRHWQLQSLTKKGEPAIIHARKEYVSHFNLPCKLMQGQSSLDKIILVGSDSE